MNVAFLASNSVKISKNTKKGTEIFVYSLIKYLARDKSLKITAFASGDSKLPVKVESVNYRSSTEDKNIGMKNHKLFELFLLNKAFMMQNKFDIFHVNITCGEIVLPFASYVKKPIIVTLHGPIDEGYLKKYFAIFKELPNVYFVSISNAQRKPCPNLNYIKTIYHGIDLKRDFTFNPAGGKQIIWTGRAIPEKGLDIVLHIIQKTKKSAKIFPMIRDEYLDWLKTVIIKRRNIINQAIRIYTDFDIHRSELKYHYQTSKLFLFPLQWEEPFGLTLIESMACGTPVVAFARGSVPEIVKDGVTGFIVNPSESDIRGNFIIKKTGVEGLCEAVEKIYSLPEEQYKQMRLACRTHVENNFTVERMVADYVKVYQQVVERNKK